MIVGQTEGCDNSYTIPNQTSMFAIKGFNTAVNRCDELRE